MDVRPLEPGERPWMLAEIARRWHGTTVARRGEAVRIEDLAALVAVESEERVGLLCYAMELHQIEVVTIDSFRPGLGVGSALLEAAARTGRLAGCWRMWLVTTSDNVQALGFYLRRGMRVVSVHHDAVAGARLKKPTIPREGETGIAIEDEIELERWL
ncbi:MAG: GNAT family N-acetyltransferase [Acidimicrobiales bacterium]